MIRFFSSLLVILFFIITSPAFSMPIDWHGSFGVDTTLIDTYRKIGHTTHTPNSGSQEVDLATGEQANASFQSYLFKLNPEIIINDSATIKGEMTTGYGRGGRLGDSAKQNKKGSMGHALYMQNMADSDNKIALTKIYMELYSDTATYVVGRYSANWGLGALINGGDNSWNRHTFVRDGITAKIKLGNFQIDPYIGKVSSAGSLTKATKSGEYGVAFLYENVQKGMSFGLLYGKKNSSHSINDPELDGQFGSLGESDVKITDIYFKQTFGDFSFEIEIPLLSGVIGHVYDTTSETKYKAKAVIFESNYKINERHNVGLFAGTISGNGGTHASFDAMYLNPNYQIANLMFRYNMQAVSDDTYSIYDSYMTNAKYIKLNYDMFTTNWDFNFAFIYAIANETATIGSSYNHLTGEIFTATTEQADDLGYEFDATMNYRWNSAITVGSSFGYHFVGDYYKYTNDITQTNSTENSFMVQLNTIINF